MVGWGGSSPYSWCSQWVSWQSKARRHPFFRSHPCCRILSSLIRPDKDHLRRLPMRAQARPRRNRDHNSQQLLSRLFLHPTGLKAKALPSMIFSSRAAACSHRRRSRKCSVRTKGQGRRSKLLNQPESRSRRPTSSSAIRRSSSIFRSRRSTRARYDSMSWKGDY